MRASTPLYAFLFVRHYNTFGLGEKNGCGHNQYQVNSRVKQTSYGFNRVNMISDEAAASNKHAAELTLFIDLQSTVVECESSQSENK